MTAWQYRVEKYRSNGVWSQSRFVPDRTHFHYVSYRLAAHCIHSLALEDREGRFRITNRLGQPVSGVFRAICVRGEWAVAETLVAGNGKMDYDR